SSICAPTGISCSCSTRGSPMSAPEGCGADPANRFDGCGLQLVEISSSEKRPDPGVRPAPAPSRAVPALRPLDWGMLTTFAVLQTAYLYGLAVLARWALRQLIEA